MQAKNELTRLKDQAARYLTKGRWEDALKTLIKASDLAPDDSYLARKIGDMYQRMGKVGKAVEAYKQAASLFAAAGFLFKAISINKIILSLQPDDREVQDSLVALYARQCTAPPEVEAQASKAQRPADQPPPGAKTGGDSAAGEGLPIDLAKVDRDRLPRMPLFSDLSPAELNQVIEKLVPMYAAAGTVICREGEEADSLFVIAGGLVQISSRDAKGNPLWLTNLSDGEFFGEFGFFSDGRRHADVVAVEDTELLQISREEIQAMVGEFPGVHDILHRFYQQRVLDTLLAKSHLFKCLKADQRRGLLRRATIETHPANSVIIEEGVDGESLYVVKSGEVEVYTSFKDKPIELAVLGAGDIFGEISLLTGTPTTANVVARTPTELVKFPKSEVVALSRKHPQLAHLLSEIKEHRVHESVRRIQLEGFV